MAIELEGSFVVDPTYGRQIEISSIIIKESPTIAFLYKCVKGIGHSLATMIVNEFGEDCIDKIKKDPSILYRVKGIKKKKLKMITESLADTEHIQLYIDIFKYFNNDVTYDQVVKIMDACQEKKSKFEEIKKNPYWLIANVDGFGFKKVDKLAIASGIKEFSYERIEAAVIYTLKYVSIKEAHCYLELDQLAKATFDLILSKPDTISKKELDKIQSDLISADKHIEKYVKDHIYSEILEDYSRKANLIIDLLSDVLTAAETDAENAVNIIIDENRIYTKELYLAETKLASHIKNMLDKKPVKEIADYDIDYFIHLIETTDEIEYAEEQKKAVKTSLHNRLSLIVGGPGRGKTTILKAIIACWDNDDEIILLAPTGRAAKRMTEATGYKAKTLQRYKNEIVKKGGRPKKKLIIMDETSMMGINLAELLFWIAEDCNLILVGDSNQLPSIEPGNFLKDLIESRCIPITFLSVGFRSDGAIAINSELINEGKGPSSYKYDETFRFISVEKEEVIDSIITSYQNYLKKYVPSEIGIISPIKSKGFGSVDLINKSIREKYNPVSKWNPDNPSGLRIYDRVMNVKNDYKRIMEDPLGNTEEGVFNGDTGTVDSIDSYGETVKILFDDGRFATYKFSEIKDFLTLAYAISIHKSQGSEYKALILIASPEYTFFMKRRMFYTAASRARVEEEIIGSKKAAAMAARDNSESKRNTHLRERINLLMSSISL